MSDQDQERQDIEQEQRHGWDIEGRDAQLRDVSARPIEGTSISEHMSTIDRRATTPEETRYFQIVKPLLERGFPVYPSHEESSKGGSEGWNRLAKDAEYADLTTHRILACKHPDRNAVVVGKRGIRAIFFLDIDSPGVLERMEAETGQKCPETYTVQTRPQTAPYKRHLYFRHSVHSIETWRREGCSARDANRLEPNKKGQMAHPTLFDLKGTGRGALVIAPGSIRPDTGEKYTCICDVAPVEMPDWMVDWLSKEVTTWRSFEAKERQTKALQQASASKACSADAAVEITDEEIWGFVNWRAHHLAGNRVSKSRIVAQIIDDISEQFPSSAAEYLDVEHQKKIRRMVRGLKLGKLGWELVSSKNKEIWSGLVVTNIEATEPSRFTRLVDAMKDFPSKISAKAGMKRLTKAGILDGIERGPAKAMVSRARRAANFQTKKVGREWLWVRLRQASVN